MITLKHRNFIFLLIFLGALFGPLPDTANAGCFNIEATCGPGGSCVEVFGPYEECSCAPNETEACAFGSGICRADSYSGMENFLYSCDNELGCSCIPNPTGSSEPCSDINDSCYGSQECCGGSGATCGNGSCDSGENPSNCSSDCAGSGPINGVCGSAINASFPYEITESNKCSQGSPGPVTGGMPWEWNCFGIDGGSTAFCHTSLAILPPPPVLTPCITNVCTNTVYPNYYYYGAVNKMISNYCLPSYDNCDSPTYKFSDGTKYWYRSDGRDATTCQNLQDPVPACIADLRAGLPSPTTAMAGVAQTFNSTISNTGVGPTGSSFNNFFQRVADFSGTSPIVDFPATNMSALNAGATGNTSVSYTPPAVGTFYLRACADKSSAVNAGSINESNESNNCSQWAAITVSANTFVPPTTPVAFWAGPSVCDSGQVNFSWNASPGATNYTIMDGSRTVYNGPYSTLFGDGLFSEFGLAPGSSHTYTITASNLYGTSAAGPTTPAVTTAPSVCNNGPIISLDPNSLTFNAYWNENPNNSGKTTMLKNIGNAVLNWQATNENPPALGNHETEYCYYQRFAGSNPKTLAVAAQEQLLIKVVPPVSIYTGTVPSPGLYNSCFIHFTDTSGVATPVDLPVIYNVMLGPIGCETSGPCPAVPPPGTAVTATASGSCSSPSIRVAWPTSGSGLGFGVNIYRSENGGALVRIVTNRSMSASPYTDTTVVNGRSYYYAIEQVYNYGQPGQVIATDKTLSNTINVSCSATTDIKANGTGGSITVDSGDPVDITWTYSNADSCLLDPAIATITVPPASGNGSFDTNLSASRTYRISCQPSGANSFDDVTVNVPIADKNLTVIKAGQGTVTSSPSGINCGGDCSEIYTPGTDVTLTETHNPGRIFTGWSGGVSCNGGNQRNSTCSFTVNSDLTVIANFAIDPSYKEF